MIKQKNIYAQLKEQKIDCEDTLRLKEVKELLLQSCSKYEKAVEINPNYINALNSWGLALSTHAKVTNTEMESELFFKLSYDRFEHAISIRPDDCNTEICNWAMTFVSHAIKRERFLQRKEFISTVPEAPTITALIKQAKLKLAPLIEKNDNWALFCMSRMYAVAKKEPKCQNWLMKCMNTNPAVLQKATKWQLAYFDTVLQSKWFQDILHPSQHLSN